jgi:uncharacterized protein with ATP-grasp and redox domains
VRKPPPNLVVHNENALEELCIPELNTGGERIAHLLYKLESHVGKELERVDLRIAYRMGHFESQCSLTTKYIVL